MTNEIIETPAIPVTAEVVNSALPSGSGVRFLLLLCGGSVFYAGAFMLSWPIVLVGITTTGLTAVAIRRRGETLISTAADFALDLVGIGQDCLQAADGHLSKAQKVIHRSALQVAASAGMLSDSEQENLNNLRSTGIIYNHDHVFQIVAGNPNNPTNAAILASSQSGKTTFLHGLILHIKTFDDRRKIIIVCDGNYGASNDGRISKWTGLPHYDGDSNPLAHDALITSYEDIYRTLVRLDDLYNERLRQATDAGKQNGEAIDFTPLYCFVDEFQTIMDHLDDEQRDNINRMVGKLLRAKKFRIYLFVILHSDEADKSIKVAKLAGLNLLILGSFNDGLLTRKELRNSRDRFTEEFAESLRVHRRKLDSEFGASASQKMLASISLADPITCTDGITFAPGLHALRLPDCREAIEVVEEYPQFTQSTVTKAKTTYAPRRQTAQVLQFPVPPAAPPEPPIEVQFREWFIQNYGLFSGQPSWSLTKFAELVKANSNLMRKRDKTDPCYLLLQRIKDHQGGTIKPSELLSAMEID